MKFNQIEDDASGISVRSEQSMGTCCNLCFEGKCFVKKLDWDMKLYTFPTNYKKIFAPTVYRFMHSSYVCHVCVYVCVCVSSKHSNTCVRMLVHTNNTNASI